MDTMTTYKSRRFAFRAMLFRAGLAIVVLTTWLGAPMPTSAQVEERSLVVQDVITDDYPDVKIRLTVPAELLGDGIQPDFAVAENGKAAELLASERLNTEAEKVDIVLAIDISGSMKGASLDSAKLAAHEFVDSLQEGNRVALVSFSDRAVVVSEFTDDTAALDKAIDALEASGETAAYDALVASGEMAKRPETSLEAIVMLSDGGDTVSRASLEDAVLTVTSAKVPVFAVALPSDEADPEALRTVAQQSGGRLVAPDDIAELPALYRGLAEEIQDRFVLVFRSARPSTKELEIKVTAVSPNGEASSEVVVDNPRYLENLAEPQAVVIPAPADVLSLASVVGLVFLSVVLLIAAVALLVIRPRNALNHVEYYEKLQGVTGDLPTAEDVDSSGLRVMMVGAVGQVASRRGITGLLHERLERAGLPLRPAEYITVHLLSVVILGVIVQWLSGQLILSSLAVVVGAFAPIVWLDTRIRSRTRAFEEQLPEVLNLIAGSLRAGWGMLQSIDLVVQEMLPPASAEFKRVQTEARLGLPLEDALESMSDRVDSDDFRWAVTAIAIQREVGGNLAEVLDVVAKTIRERGTLRRHISSLTAEGRISAGILIALPFVEVAVLLTVNPTYMTPLFTTPIGWAMLATALVLMVVGAFWLRSAMTVEV